MLLGQYIVVRVTPDEKNYTYWVVDPAQGGPAMPNEPLQSIGNRTTSSTTLKNAIGTEMPTLST